jgi:hypothetical protein
MKVPGKVVRQLSAHTSTIRSDHGELMLLGKCRRTCARPRAASVARKMPARLANSRFTARGRERSRDCAPLRRRGAGSPMPACRRGIFRRRAPDLRGAPDCRRSNRAAATIYRAARIKD